MNNLFRITLLLNVVVGIFVYQALLLPPTPEGVYQDLKIDFLYFGSEEHAYHPRVVDGARLAASVTGARVNLIPTSYDGASLLHAVKASTLRKPDIICVPGMRDLPALYTFLDEATAQGITVTTYDEQPGPVPARLKGRGTGFIGEEPHQSGRDVAAELLRRFPLSRDKAVLIVARSATDGQYRAAGCAEYLAEQGLASEFINRPLGSTSRVSTTLRRKLNRPDEYWGGVICVSDRTDAIARIVNGPGVDIPIVGYGYSDTIQELLLNEEIDFVYAPQWFAQGAVPVIQACIARSENLVGLECTLPAAFIDRARIVASIPASSRERE